MDDVADRRQRPHHGRGAQEERTPESPVPAPEPAGGLHPLRQRAGPDPPQPLHPHGGQLAEPGHHDDGPPPARQRALADDPVRLLRRTPGSVKETQTSLTSQGKRTVGVDCLV